MAQVARRDANTDLYVSSDASKSLRLTVRIDGAVAYDARVPGAGDCMHPPIYRSSYRLPDGAALQVHEGGPNHLPCAMESSRALESVGFEQGEEQVTAVVTVQWALTD